MLCVIVSAAQNDFFMQSLLRRLSAGAVEVVLLFLRQVLKIRCSSSAKALDRFAPAGLWLRGAPLPTMHQAVGWASMLLDGHFAALVLHAAGGDGRSKAAKGLGKVVSELGDLVHGACNQLDAAAGLKGYLGMFRYDQQILQSTTKRAAGYSVEVLHL